MAADGLEEIVNLFEAPVKIDAALSKLSTWGKGRWVRSALVFGFVLIYGGHDADHPHLQLKWSKQSRRRSKVQIRNPLPNSVLGQWN